MSFQRYIPEIDKVTKVKQLSPTAIIWTLHYKFTPPVSPRVFTVLQVTHLDEGVVESTTDGTAKGNKATTRRTGIIVSIPIDLSSPSDDSLASLEEKGVRGRYVSVERIQELENGKIEWRMATSSTPGGSIPSFIVESTMAGKIAQDVPHFFKWLKSLPPEAPTASATD
ncbi:hypothetical protein AX16_008796 [Volvariella volvacea WC 439]|nr:hypothetical protein AX16_008796 [Volvariella volvacea WC 439]